MRRLTPFKSGGSTAMSSGIDIAYDMAWEAFEPGAENRVVVLSDGDANVRQTPAGKPCSVKSRAMPIEA